MGLAETPAPTGLAEERIAVMPFSLLQPLSEENACHGEKRSGCQARSKATSAGADAITTRRATRQ